MQPHAVALQLLDKVEQPVGGLFEGRSLGDLRADVAVDAHHLQVRIGMGAAIQLGRLSVRDAELARFEAGRDIRVRAGIDVGVHSQRYRRALAEPARDLRDLLQLEFGFDVEAPDPGAQRPLDLRRGLANAGEHDPRRRAACRDNARELAAGDDIESAAGARQQAEHAQVGVGFDGVTDQRRPTRQRLLVLL